VPTATELADGTVRRELNLGDSSDLKPISDIEIMRWRCHPSHVNTDIESDPQALAALQRAIYLEKVERAGAMTVSERLESVLECSDLGLEMMFSQIRSTDSRLSDEAVWAEAGARIDRVRRARERHRYEPSTP
jgi:hypothetical protein